MKTHEEIKDSLKVCMAKMLIPKYLDCKCCPFTKTELCDGKRHAQALAYIERLEAERDAAVMDLKMYAGCVVCKDYAVAGLYDCSGCDHENELFEWRGVCEENSGKEADAHA